MTFETRPDEIIRLWPDGPPSKPEGVGVIVCPGGGWRILAWEHEGTEVVRWLTAHGYTAFLLKYRVSASGRRNRRRGR